MAQLAQNSACNNCRVREMMKEPRKKGERGESQCTKNSDDAKITLYQNILGLFLQVIQHTIVLKNE